ncbi:phospholipase D-like domain-containing protein [Brumimicrobium mesophilum]|uniref:phospholipase D-like domain-containing protein n=1 Tax=Brumimicrobium mesophilum TaxID=392717 RepID=UPI001F2886F7|nr:phospholipase D-like domain-containing protein [Brumimicrobium mesophilum]
MIKPFNDDFKNSLFTGFLDKNVESELGYRPQLLTNKKIPREKVLSTLLQEFHTCSEFFISVAFVTTGGIAVLLNTLISLEKRGVKGKVLVSQYLNFTQPEALKKLQLFSNIELKISTQDNTHSKGYIFKKKEHYNLIVGSSNITSSALTVNKEWNLKVSGLNSSSIVENVLKEFQNDFDCATPVTNEFIVEYELVYNSQLLFRERTKKELSSSEVDEVEPNSMQQEALKNLVKLRLEENQSFNYISNWDWKNLLVCI